jgi:hypothetical protein
MRTVAFSASPAGFSSPSPDFSRQTPSARNTAHGDVFVKFGMAVTATEAASLPSSKELQNYVVSTFYQTLMRQDIGATQREIYAWRKQYPDFSKECRQAAEGVLGDSEEARFLADLLEVEDKILEIKDKPLSEVDIDDIGDGDDSNGIMAMRRLVTQIAAEEIVAQTKRRMPGFLNPSGLAEEQLCRELVSLFIPILKDQTIGAAHLPYHWFKGTFMKHDRPGAIGRVLELDFQIIFKVLGLEKVQKGIEQPDFDAFMSEREELKDLLATEPESDKTQALLKKHEDPMLIVRKALLDRIKKLTKRQADAACDFLAKQS